MFANLRSTVVALAVLSIGQRVAAQQSDTTRVAPVVVTATRVPIDARTAPATIDVITGDELRRRGSTSVADALQSVAGVTFAQSGSFGAVTSLFMRGGESKYVKVLIDGVPVNDPGGAIDFGRLTTDNVERIEVVRGPASVLYGADAVTGVIQIFTRRGHGKPSTVVSARGGTYGSSDADVTMLGEVGGGDFSVGVARHDTRGIYAFNSGYHNTVASGSMHFLVDPSTELRVSLRYADDAFHYPTNGGGAAVDTNAHNSQDRTVLAVDAAHFFTPRVNAQLSLTAEGTAGGTDDKPDTETGSGFQSSDHTRRRGADLRTNIELPRTTVTIGVQAEQEDQHTESQSTFGGDVSPSIFRASRRNTALYGQSLVRLPAAVIVTAGARADDNERFGTFGTYRVGGSWAPLEHTHLRATVGTAFREPTFFENYATGFVTGNQNLAPERSSMWELGLRQGFWNDRVTLGVTHFDQRFRNMIDYTGATSACGASYCNVARAAAKGRELEARVSPVASLAFDANLTHLETKVLEAGFDSTSGGLYHQNEELIRRPTTSWNVGAAYTHRRATVDLRVMHVGDRSDRDFRLYPATPVVVPAYTRADLGAVIPVEVLGARAGGRGVDLTLRVENLFDAKYESVFNFRTPRRTILAGARATF